MSVTLGRWLSEYVTGSFSLVAEQLNFRDPQAGICPDLVPLVCGQLGNQSTTGFRTASVQGYAGLLFRSENRLALQCRSRSRARPTWEEPIISINTIWMSSNSRRSHGYSILAPGSLWSGRRADGKPIPLTERFFVGGINTMRGFVFGRAGPGDAQRIAVRCGQES